MSTSYGATFEFTDEILVRRLKQQPLTTEYFSMLLFVMFYVWRLFPKLIQLPQATVLLLQFLFTFDY